MQYTITAHGPEYFEVLVDTPKTDDAVSELELLGVKTSLEDAVVFASRHARCPVFDIHFNMCVLVESPI